MKIKFPLIFALNVKVGRDTPCAPQCCLTTPARRGLTRPTIIRHAILLLLLLSNLNPQLSTAHAQGTAFTYQGQLQNNGSPASGSYNLTFTLFTNSVGGTAAAGPVTNNAVVVTNGLFTVLIGFGPGVFTGATNWLQIGVATNGVSSFTPLTPRQELTPTPYAIYAESVGASGISGTYGSPVAFNNGANSFDGSFYGAFYGSSFIGGNFIGNFNGSGSGLTGVWVTGGNSGTTPGVNYVGTSDNEPLELHVNGVRALRLEPGSLGGNVIGGASVNFVSPGTSGATIGGGGTIAYYSSPASSNSVTANFGTVGGGAGNTASGEWATVGGGDGNTASGQAPVIGGGTGNNISGIGYDFIGGGVYNTASGGWATVSGSDQNTASGEIATVGGGYLNTASGYGSFIGGGGYDGVNPSGNSALGNASVIGGGLGNSIQTNSAYATISGGSHNSINTNSSYSTIGGGGYNLIDTNNSAAAIAGGSYNQILANDANSFIGGGYLNKVSTNSVQATISGGYNNNIGAAAVYSTIGGGYQNVIQAGAFYATVGGGVQNVIQAGALYATVGGGGGNISSNYATVSGGYYNTASGVAATVGGGNVNNASSFFATVGGGQYNTASALFATLGGGQYNTNSGNYATVGGGVSNQVINSYATVPGGANNIAGGQYSFAAGNYAQALNQAAFVWGDGNGITTSTATNQFMVRASGGVIIYSSSGTAAGVSLAAGSGTWSSLSDRNAKNGFAPVTPQQVLAQVAALPITKWSYKTEQGVRHIGPMAQDFHAAFGVGEDDRHITTVDEDGVALAAIQGLNQKLNEKDTEIQKLKEKADRVDSLEKRLNELEHMVQSLAATK
jgi:hypothetical protein